YEEKISWRAESLGLSWRGLARRETGRFHADLDRLGILPPHCEPKASDFVRPMIDVARRLARKGKVLRRGDSWVWVPPPPSHRNFPVGDEFSEHAVLEPGVEPPSPDAAREIELWRKESAPLPNWPSPWGRGAPGWHLECYAMATRHLGLPVDLCGGGVDLIFPHHYAGNEIALALDESLFARQFLHTGFVTQLHRKMSKSRGNLVALGPAIERYGPDALRWYLLGRPYNSRIEWSEEEAAAVALEWAEIRRRLRSAVGAGAGGTLDPSGFTVLPEAVTLAVENGLGVQAAYDRLRALAATIGAAAGPRVPRGEQKAARAGLRGMERVLGLHVL
ncbi:MAG TPA: class I tRNA ligase family protein, partial [Thermoplasmata archaeon]|nr:class I tRNA ligase family protein [Thermoplasmata archaeon]